MKIFWVAVLAVCASCVFMAPSAMAQHRTGRFVEPYVEPPPIIFGDAGGVITLSTDPTLTLWDGDKHQMLASSTVGVEFDSGNGVEFTIDERSDDDETLAAHLTINGQDIFHAVVDGDEWFAEGWDRRRKDICVTALVHDIMLSALDYKKSKLADAACGIEAKP